MADRLTLARPRPHRRARTRGIRRRRRLAVGAVAAAALVPWPDHRAEAPSVLVQPAESRPVARLPRPAARRSARTRPPPRPPPRSARPTSRPPRNRPTPRSRGAARRTRQPRRGGDGAPLASPPNRAASTPACSRARSRRACRPRRSAGSPLPSCGEAVAESWLVGGGDQPRPHRTRAPGEPDRRRRDRRRAGDRRGGPRRGALGARHHRAPRQPAGALPRRPRPEPRLTGRARHEHGRRDRREPRALGRRRARPPPASSSSAPTALPATTQVIPGFVVPSDGGVAPAEDHADGDDFPAVRLFATGDATGRRVDRRRARVGRRRSTVDATLEPGLVTDVPLGVLDAGDYTIRLEADEPVRRRGPRDGRRCRRADGCRPRHRRTSPGRSPPRRSSTSAVIAVPPGPSPMLHLVNPGDARSRCARRGRRGARP